MEQSRITNTTIVALIVGLIIGFAGGAYWYKSKMTAANSLVEKTEDLVDDEDSDEVMIKDEDLMVKIKDSAPSTSTVVDANIVAASNQNAGKIVIVNKVVTNTEIWVAVREDISGLMGNILGAKKVGIGTSENIAVELLRPTVLNSKYYVVLYRDNGDGAFDPKVDTLVESDGSVIVSVFRTQ